MLGRVVYSIIVFNHHRMQFVSGNATLNYIIIMILIINSEKIGSGPTNG